MLDSVIQFAAGCPNQTVVSTDESTYTAASKNKLWFQLPDGTYHDVGSSAPSDRTELMGWTLLTTCYDGGSFVKRELFTLPLTWEGIIRVESRKEVFRGDILCKSVFVIPNANALFVAEDTNCLVELLIQFNNVRDLSPNNLTIPVFFTVNNAATPAVQVEGLIDGLVASIKRHPLLKRFLTVTKDSGTQFTIIAQENPYSIGQWWDYDLVNFTVSLTKQSKLLQKQAIGAITNTLPAKGIGGWQQMADVERKTLGHRGITNMSLIPIIMPEWQVQSGTDFDEVVSVNFKKVYQAADGITRETNEACVLALNTDSDGSGGAWMTRFNLIIGLI